MLTRPSTKTARFITKIKEDVQIITIDFVDKEQTSSNLIRKKQMRPFSAAARNYKQFSHNASKDLAKYAVFFKNELV